MPPHDPLADSFSIQASKFACVTSRHTVYTTSLLGVIKPFGLNNTQGDSPFLYRVANSSTGECLHRKFLKLPWEILILKPSMNSSTTYQ